jgi:hypothetical protein
VFQDLLYDLTLFMSSWPLKLTSGFAGQDPNIVHTAPFAILNPANQNGSFALFAIIGGMFLGILRKRIGLLTLKLPARIFVLLRR